MMSEDEIAWLLMRLVAGAAYYAGESFEHFSSLDTAEQIRHASALIAELPDNERKEIADAYDRAVAARLIAGAATHHAPVIMQ